MKIDIEECEKQRRESILKSGKYARMEIIVPIKGERPVVNIEAQEASSKEIALLLAIIKPSVAAIIEKDPIAGLIAANIKLKGMLYKGDNKETGEMKDETNATN